MKERRLPSILAGAAALAAAAGVVALMASVLSTLRHALGRRHREPESERERVRRVLGPMLMEIDREAWERVFGRLPDGFDREAFRRSLPILDPPLSRTIIEEREEERRGES